MLLLAGLALAGCSQTARTSAAITSPAMTGGRTVAFEIIDGPPSDVFQRLVQKLDEEAQARQVPVVSREGKAQYRIRGYLAAHVSGGRTAISWVWDVYDAELRRTLRISGEEAVSGNVRDAWGGADDALLRRIAQTGMGQLAALMTAPGSAPAPAEPVPPSDGGRGVAERPSGTVALAGIQQ